LAHDPPLSRAKHRANRQLLLPRLGPRQQQVRDIRARDQQHRADGEQQHEERGPHLAEHLGGRGHDRQPELRIVVVGIRLQKSARDGVDLRLRLRQRHARPDSSQRKQPVIPSLARIRWLECERHPHRTERPARVLDRESHRRRQDADDGIRHGVELNVASDD